MDLAEQLIAELDRAGSWPIPRERDYHQILLERRAIRKGDKGEIRRLMRWDDFPAGDGHERNLVIDPLPRLITRAFADFLFGEDPAIRLPRGADDDLVAQLDDVNQLADGLHRAIRIASGEGEVWGVAHVNTDVADMPLLEWRSRLSVVPMFYGARVLAAAFVTERQREMVDTGTETGPAEVVWRHVEVHAHGVVRNVLYKGNESSLGTREPLEAIASTADLEEVRHHGLPMLAWRLVNDLDDDPHLGEDDLTQIRDELFMLNEALTIASENARLTGKDRVFATGEMLRKDGSLPTGVEIFQVTEEGQMLGQGSTRPPVVAVEKTYDAVPLWLHVSKLVALALTRVGMVPQFIGEDVEGSASDSGTAIRLRFMPTDNAARGKARGCDALLPRIIDTLLRLAALPVAQGGFDASYNPDGLPSVERGDVLPVDEGERIRDNATAVTAGIRSRRSAIREIHPDWDDDQVDAELRQVLDEERQLVGAVVEPPPPPVGDE